MGEELQRARIVRAIAQEMAAREDPHAVTVADVVIRAGVPRRAFHELYADIDECLLGAFDWCLRLAGTEMYAAYSHELRWQDGVRGALAALLGLLDAEPALARLCIVYALGAGGPVLRRRMGAIDVLCEYVDRGRLESSCRTEPPEMAAEGVVGAVLAVIHTRLLAAGGQSDAPPLSDLLGPLMSLILLPYMGAAKASRELSRSTRRPSSGGRASDRDAAEDAPKVGGLAGADVLTGELGMRLTYRTALVLQTIGERPGASNREVADLAGVVDQGQISRLLSRLEGLGLIANRGGGAGGAQGRGAANAWVLTPRGERVARGVVPNGRRS
jgi:AcrR family transcriptional regulator/DNA-binding MarR family transcriptional regulator